MFTMNGFENISDAQTPPKANENFGSRLRRLFTGSMLAGDQMEALEAILISGDVGVTLSQTILQQLKQELQSGPDQTPNTAVCTLKNILIRTLEAAEPKPLPAVRPLVYLIVGVNGTGKTTTIGKLAARLTSQHGRRVMLAAADTFRAAAIEQLEIWANRSGADLVKHQIGGDAAAVAYDAYAAAKARDMDVLIIDTAGRLHTKSNLMEELKKIKRVLQKHDPALPHECLLVMDATTGQNGISQCRQFHEQMNLSGICLTKLDGTARGGIVFAIQKAFGVPVKFVGAGEGLDDLADFNAAVFVDALFEEPAPPVKTQLDKLLKPAVSASESAEAQAVPAAPAKKKPLGKRSFRARAVIVSVLACLILAGAGAFFYYRWLDNLFNKADRLFLKGDFSASLEIYHRLENKPFLKHRHDKILYERLEEASEQREKVK